MATLSISLHKLNTPFVSRLLYVSAFIPVSTSPSPSVYHTLVDSGVTINLIHKSVVSFLRLIVDPHRGLLVTLADGKTVVPCSGYVSLSCTIADVSYSGIFFVAPLGTQSLILGMPYLERENPVIDWQAKTLAPPLNPSLNLLLPTLPPIPELLPVLPNPPNPPNLCLKCRLPRIFPT